jgi:DNA-binding Lrp family transcriptional regulator
VLLSAAFAEAAVPDFKPAAMRRSPREKAASAAWYADVVRTCLEMSHKLRNALVHEWEPTPRAENLAEEAFLLLSGLTPAAGELLRLHQSDRRRAYAELAKHLDAITREFELSAELIAEVEGIDDPTRQLEDQRFAELRDSLLKKSGGSLSLTQAANLLGISRQALHKRIKTGSALGMMRGNELVLPRAQFADRGRRHEILPGIPEIVRLFSVAGGWSALQFLVEADPNLAKPPIQALKEGRVAEVVRAAKAYLDAEDG